MIQVVFDVKTTNLTTIDTNKHYNCIDLRSRFKFLEEQARTMYMIQNSYCNDSRQIWRKMNWLKVVKDQDLTIENKDYTKQARIEKELNQKFESREEYKVGPKWIKFRFKFSFNWHKIWTN